MSLCNSSRLAVFAVSLLVVGATGSACAQCVECATEWSGGSVINLGALPGSTYSFALGINDAGQTVGVSGVGGVGAATEWSGGGVINLGALPGSTSSAATGINDAGQTVGYSGVGSDDATEWSGGNVINLGGLPGSFFSDALGINDAGQAVGYSIFPSPPAPEPSTWAMMLLGFAGLGYAGYWRARKGKTGQATV